MLAAALLHDVCEDCGVKPEELPVGPEAREVVRLVTKPEDRTHFSEEAYYREILEQIGSSPENALMVGNDVKEDMETAAAVGMKGFLMTGYLLNREGKDISGYPQGDFSELRKYIETLS